MTVEQQVLEVAEARAAALAAGDAARLEDLLHVDFRWTSHTGEQFDRDSYIDSNTAGTTVWRSQTLDDPEVVVAGTAAVLHCVVADEIHTANGPQVFRMPMTQVWVLNDSGWTCLAGHAGPLQLPASDYARGQRIRSCS